MAVLQINSGIDYKRIVAYLEDELGLVAEEAGVYRLPECLIKLEPIKTEHPVLKIPRTMVTFSGEEEACRLQQKHFRMRFLSAGG